MGIKRPEIVPPKTILYAKGSAEAQSKSEVLAFWCPTTVQAALVQSLV